MMRLSDQVGHDWAVLLPKINDESPGTRWRGASRVLRSMQSWLTSIGSPTSDLPSAELRVLRSRSRDAHRNHLLGRAPIARSRTNIVGTGLICRPNVDHKTLDLTEDEAEVLNELLLAHFERWAEDSFECDLEATFDFYGLQGLTLVSAMLSGDVFVLTPERARTGGITELKLQLIEADRVSNPYDRPDTPNCIDGIEINDSMPVGCWVRDTHPGDRNWVAPPKWTYYPFFGQETGRRRVLHIWNEKDRPGQMRGAPYLAPILEPLKLLERFSNAELMAAVVSAMLTVFIQKDGEKYDAGEDGEEKEALPVNSDGNIELGNAAVVDLAVGETANMVNPLRPNSNFDPFFMAMTKQFGAALELPHDEILLVYEKSYSAARAAMLQAWRFYSMRRWFLVQQFCQPVYSLVIDEAVAAGRLSLPGYGNPIRRRAYTRAMWIGPARGAMDELKEAKAARERIDGGLSNEAIESAAMTGEDWNSIYAQRMREIKRRRADGTYSEPKPPSDLPPDPPSDNTGNDA